MWGNRFQRTEESFFYASATAGIWVMHVFFHCLKHTFTKYSALKIVIVKLCFDDKTRNHSGLDFLNTSTLLHTFHISIYAAIKILHSILKKKMLIFFLF